MDADIAASQVKEENEQMDVKITSLDPDLPSSTAAPPGLCAPRRGPLSVSLALRGVVHPVFYRAHHLCHLSKFVSVAAQWTGLGAATTSFNGLGNYLDVVRDPNFYSSLGRVLLYGIVQVPIMLLIALLLALLLDSAVVRLKAFFRVAFFVPFAIPGIIAALLVGLFLPTRLQPHRQRLPGPRLAGSRFPGTGRGALVDCQHRRLDLRGLQHAHHLRRPASHPQRNLRVGSRRRLYRLARGLEHQNPAGGSCPDADLHLLHRGHLAALRRTPGALGHLQQHLHVLHARLLCLHHRL